MELWRKTPRNECGVCENLDSIVGYPNTSVNSKELQCPKKKHLISQDENRNVDLIGQYRRGFVKRNIRST